MKALQCLLFAALTLSISACQSDLPNIGTKPSSLPIDSGITPSPKGPKPFPFAYEIPIGQFRSDSLSLNRNLAGTPEATKNTTGQGGVTNTSPMVPPLATGQVPVLSPATDSATTQNPQDPQQAILVPPGSESPEPIESPSAEASVQPSPQATATPEPGQSKQVYLTFEASASSANVEQTKYALKQGVLPDPTWLRPWEFLSFETFRSNNKAALGPFQGSMGLWQHPIPGQSNKTAYDLGLHVSSPDVSLQTRRNLVLTLLIDVSGSMNNSPATQLDQKSQSLSLMDLAKEGLKTLPAQLKPGDIINLVSFSDQAKILLKNWTYTGNQQDFLAAIDQLQPEASTNLAAGLQTAYDLARSQYDPAKSNRVLMLSDQQSGQIEGRLIQEASQFNQAEGIYFSGLGFGENSHSSFLRSLSEAGQGRYASVQTLRDAQRVFGKEFLSLMYTAARNVQFRLDYPAELKRLMTKSESSSADTGEIQSNHFGNNRSQYFLEQFKADRDLGQAEFSLTISYEDPQTGNKRNEVLKLSLQNLLNQELDNIKDAHMITLLNSLIQGKVSPDYAQRELAEVLTNHSTPLANEYQNYIQSWLQKHE